MKTENECKYDMITERQICINVLNKKKITPREMDDYMMKDD